MHRPFRGRDARISAPIIRGIASVVAVAFLAGDAPGAEKLRFNRDIRPILTEKCFACHGPAAKRDDGEIRLDLRDELLQPDSEGRAVLVPGKPEESELVRRILAADDSLRMPPTQTKKPLTDEEKQRLVRWVREGAEYEPHWAFVSPGRPPLPDVKRTDWPRNEIDRFVLARLEQEGLSPSPPADKPTLLRRLSLDLVGLPPTLAELDAFLADDSPDAYAKQVERLLESPHYGERWGRWWLDAARYADSDGFEKDKPRFVSRYRDWVIRALNDDLPYDQFIINQIAGDLKPNATQDDLVATGFLRNSMINEEGGVDPEQFRMEAMFDRMDAIGKSILGLTIQCGQCHSHKYDPLTQEEYYRMFAFVNNSHEGSVATYAPEQLQQRAEILRKIQDLEAEYRHRHPDWADKVAAWEDVVRSRRSQWTVIQTTEDDLSGGQKMYRMKDGSYLCQGYAPTKHTVTIRVAVPLAEITAFRLEQLNDPNLPLGGPGRSIQGTSALTEFKVRAWPIGQPDQSVWVKFSRAEATLESLEKPLPAIYFDKTDRQRLLGPAAFAIDGKDETAWGIDVDPVRRNRPCQAVFIAETPIVNPQGSMIEVHLVQNHGGWNSDDNQNHNLGRFRLAVTSAAPPEALADLVPPDLRDILEIPPRQRTPAQTAAVFSAWRERAAECRELSTHIDELWRQHPEPVSQLVMQERCEPRMTSLLNRGDFLKPVRPVEPGVPAFLHPLSDARRSPGGRPDRLDFAMWLADRRSPTTARSLVNRIWQAYYGEGLVTTADDLGLQSSPPTHPELLDWLAVEFMDRGWSLKRLHRLIVHSATYQQSSRVSEELARRDPQNRWLARGPRFRVDAEIVRDIALAASGLLNPKIGGPSVYPPAPDFLFVPPASYGPKVWNEDRGPDRYRRALYTFRFRSVPYPMLQTFDAPNGDVSCVRRPRSNTPLQALTTLNEPIFLECARALGRCAAVDGGADDAQRLAFAFRRCTARLPNERESSVLLNLLEKERRRFASGELHPWEFAADDPQIPPALPEGVSPADVAAWTAVCRVLLNLDETITKE
jgi:hypothetical protein